MSCCQEVIGKAVNVSDVKVLTPRECGQLLRLSKNAIYAALRRGDIKSIRIGRKILVPMSALEKLLDGSASTKTP